MESKYKKVLGVFLFVIAVFAALVIFHRMGYYHFEYDEKFAPYDYGKFNFFSYFTVQSNIFVCIYLFFVSFSMFGFEKAKKVSENPFVTVAATVYIIVTGAVYCSGIPLGFTPPFTWDSSVHAMTSFIQVFHHMIIPPLMVLLLIFRKNSKKFNYKLLPYIGIYPFVYSLFSIIRGKISNPKFYAYPFYNPEFVYGLFIKNQAADEKIGYLLMLVLLVFGISLFIGIGALVALIYNKRQVGETK